MILEIIIAESVSKWNSLKIITSFWVLKYYMYDSINIKIEYNTNNFLSKKRKVESEILDIQFVITWSNKKTL